MVTSALKKFFNYGIDSIFKRRLSGTVRQKNLVDLDLSLSSVEMMLRKLSAISTIKLSKAEMSPSRLPRRKALVAVVLAEGAGVAVGVVDMGAEEAEVISVGEDTAVEVVGQAMVVAEIVRMVGEVVGEVLVVDTKTVVAGRRRRAVVTMIGAQRLLAVEIMADAEATMVDVELTMAEGAPTTVDGAPIT
jgi:hypothetical protein